MAHGFKTIVFCR